MHLQVVPVPTDDLLSKEYAKRRRAEAYSPDKAGRLLTPPHAHCPSNAARIHARPWLVRARAWSVGWWHGMLRSLPSARGHCDWGHPIVRCPKP